MIIQIFAIFLTAIAGGLIAWRFKQPLISGYLLASVLVGTLFGSILQPSANEAVGQLGLTLLLFSIGLEFSFKRLIRVKKIAIFGALIQIIITTGLFYLFFNSLILAYAFSMASTAVISKVLMEKGKTDTLLGEIAIGWLMIQDMAVIPALIIISQIGSIGQISLGVLKSIIILYLIIFLGKKVLPKVLDQVAKINNREIFSLTIIVIILTSAALAGFAGLSIAIGAFIAGLIIAESAQNHTVFAEIRPLRDVFAVIFFVGIGLGTNLTYLTDLTNLSGIVLATVAIFLTKIVVSIIITFKFKYHLKTAMEVGFAVAGVGEFALILGLAALHNNLITADQNSFLGMVAIVNLAVSPTIINLGLPIFEKTKEAARKWSPKLFAKVFAEVDHQNLGSDKNYSNHIVICGHGRVGRQISRVLSLAGVTYVVVDYNPNIIEELNSSGVQTILGDPADLEVLKAAGVVRAVAIIIAVPDRHSQELVISHALSLKPGLPIICRSHFDEDRLHLYALGVNYVVQPEMEAGLTMGHKLLDVLGFEKNTINAFVRQVRKEQER